MPSRPFAFFVPRLRHYAIFEMVDADVADALSLIMLLPDY